jgi:hypothetical protein
MAILLFSLRGVPEDEAHEVRELLAEHQIDFYETFAGNWGISMPALWLRDAYELEKARQLLDAYQHQRYAEQHEIYLQLKRTGRHKTLLQAFTEKPLLYGLSVVTMLLIIYVSIKLVLEFGF